MVSDKYRPIPSSGERISVKEALQEQQRQQPKRRSSPSEDQEARLRSDNNQKPKW